MTTRCNTNCFSCCHTPDMKTFLDTDKLISFMDEDACSLVGRISFCGRAGDALFHPDFLKFVKHLKSIRRELPLQFLTNGSARPISWWEDLARSFHNKTDNIVFALDGVGDTHSIHRPGTNYLIVLRNLIAFIKGGGRADWQFILFKHNQHQVEEARKIALDIGCEKFRVIPSRMYNDTFERPTVDLNLTPPSILCYQDEKDKGEHTVHCRHTKFDKGLYLGADGIVSPCLFLSTLDRKHIRNNNIKLSPKFLVQYYKHMKYLDIYQGNKFRDILESDYFKWVAKNHKDIATCEVMCGYN